jgi:hypothetical protein
VVFVTVDTNEGSVDIHASFELRWIIAITMFHITHPRTTEWVNSLPLLRHINNVQQQQAAFSMDFRQTVNDMAHLKRSLLLP